MRKEYTEQEARDSMSVFDWLSRGKAWDWWSTWTFEYECSGWSAERAWKRFADEYLGHGVSYLYVIEANRTRAGTHVHAVVGNVSHLYRRIVWQAWFQRYGRCHIVPYDKGKGFECAEYLGKYMTKSRGDLWNVRIPAQGSLGVRFRPASPQVGAARVNAGAVHFADESLKPAAFDAGVACSRHKNAPELSRDRERVRNRSSDLDRVYRAKTERFYASLDMREMRTRNVPKVIEQLRLEA